MPQRDHLSIVCRDCGEVTHHTLVGMKPGAMVSCGACGLVIDPTPFRGPAVNLGLGLGPGAAGRPGPAAKPRRGPGAKAPSR